MLLNKHLGGAERSAIVVLTLPGSVHDIIATSHPSDTMQNSFFRAAGKNNVDIGGAFVGRDLMFQLVPVGTAELATAGKVGGKGAAAGVTS